MSWRRLAAALGMTLALGAVVPTARASGKNPAYLDVKVTFTGNFSVAIDGLRYSTRTFSVGPGEHVIPTSATVTNDSTGLTEKWQLSVATAAGNGNWAVQSSTGDALGVDQYALQAVFMSSAAAETDGCPDDTDDKWNTILSTVTGTPKTYMSTRYADPEFINGASGNPDQVMGSSDGNMFRTNAGGRGRRKLCVRFIMGNGSSTTTEQLIRMSITALAGQ